MIYLNDLWSFYFHDPYDVKWDIKSFELIANIASVDDFIKIFNIYKNIINYGMFFIMREHILPLWEDENNINGGCLSYKLFKDEITDKFFNICCLLLGETLGKENNIIENINGISISPKKNYYILRIWIKDSKFSDKENYNIEPLKYTTILFKEHNM
jgi:hypothetical protein